MYISYTAGAHDAIKGHHAFFLNEPAHVGASFDYAVNSGAPNDIYVMICGRVTLGQRDIIKIRCNINIKRKRDNIQLIFKSLTIVDLPIYF